MESNKSVFQKILGKSKKSPLDFELWNAAYLLCREQELGAEKWEMCADLKSALAKTLSQIPCGDPTLQDVFREVLLLEARGARFDSYMQYVEMAREPEKRFWMPRRKLLLPVANAIQKLIDGEIEILTISLPPGTGKSTLEIFLHSMMIGINPDKPSLASGHSGILTNSIYEGVLSILNDTEEYLWHEIFPEHKNIITNAKEQTIDVDKKHRFSSLTCRAIGASLTGATRCEQFLTADDLVSGIEEAVSIPRLDKLWQAYTNDLKSRKKLGCRELHLATRWSVHDVIGRLETMYSSDPKFMALVVPALDEKGESNFNYDYGVGFDKKFFDDMADTLDDASFKALFMNQPIEREGLLYPVDSLNRYFDLPPETPDAIVSVCDTKDKGKDFCAMPVGYLYGDRVYVEDVVYDDSLPEVYIPRLEDMILKHNVQRAHFESNSAGGRIAEEIRTFLRPKSRVSITTEYTTQNKETKILVNSDWVKEHCYFKDASMYARQSDYGKFMDALCSYTHMGKNPHDDAPDAMAMLALFVDSLTSRKIEVFKRPW